MKRRNARKKLQEIAVTLLGNFLRAEIDRQGLSQNQLAVKSGLQESTISDIINGKTKRPNPSTLNKLAVAIERPAADLTALVGYTTENGTVPNDHHFRMARLMDSFPWLEAGIDKWLQLPENEQADILSQIEYKLDRLNRKDQK